MNTTDKRAREQVVKYLDEALATERGMARTLSSQITMTPAGSYRTALERHLRETRGHADRVEDRLEQLGGGMGTLESGRQVAESAIAQLIALGKMPLDLVRGSGGEEKVLENARDAAASEALEMAMYSAIARFAERSGDEQTAELAREILADEERMFDQVLGEIDRLTDQVFDAEVRGRPQYDVTTTGAADTIRSLRPSGDEGELPIRGYDELNADEVVSRLRGLTQAELERVDRHEKANQDRSTVRERIAALRESEPFPGYDDMTAGEVVEQLRTHNGDSASVVARYERSHKNRSTVLQAATHRVPSGA